ncbi:MAG: hypothetical protein C7K11_02060 [Candidatus Amulumruptor caecigallinarius]|uniref:DUF6249 domain-containing protein n=1 Tax=Candidatus Amulumruptor caecigallinarius TaxID=2109911 RepID=A0A4Q0UAF4_9BACT|nr:MAG: hypothetical protein C7K11_02060 [Candidatus Amulumruptor caecigallinarius]HJE39106.1 DUF6249 domain-containing protein [Candidatus Amulumruptor caecigallinarius]
MKHTVFSLFLALFAFCALPSLSLAANPAAANDSADIALEKALADLRNGSDTANTQDETKVEEVTFDNGSGVSISSKDISNDVLDGLRDFDTDDSEAAVAVLAILGIFFMPFIMVIGVVWVICAYRANERRQRYTLVSKAIDNNYPLPPTVFERNMKSPIRSSAYLLAVGLAVIIFFICVGEWTIGLAIGCIPILIGAAKFTAYNLENKDRQ